ncbi:MAG: hypothetical protein IRY91_07750 [Gemmatimonadaceae bacterium]|nr:hypothetical protein [Gemmatimonadaceae bacterium]
MIEPLELLARPDKWYLSAADGILFAPPAPAWLDRPGFWDEATLYHCAFAPVFTVAALDGDGREIALRVSSRRWTPAELTVEYRLANGMTATEVRTVQPGGVFASEWRVHGMRAAPIHLIAWTAQDAATLDGASVEYNGALAFARTVRDERGRALAVRAELAAAGGATSWSVALADGAVGHPHWVQTPFVEQWGSEGQGLPRAAVLGDPSAGGVFYGAVHRHIEAGPDGAAAAFAMRLAITDPALQRAEPAASSPARDVATPAAAAPAATLGGASRRRWQELFARVPEFRCSDPYLEHYYWYRWYGIWLNAVAPGTGCFAAPTVCEGVGSLHQPTALAAQCHARELRWLRTPDYARGVLTTFLAAQRRDGSLPASVLVDGAEPPGIGHVNWGDALHAVDVVWPDDEFLRRVYVPLARYARWLLAARDREGTGLIDLVSRAEVSQPYVAAPPEGEREGTHRRPLKGVEATVHAYTLMRTLARIAPRAGAAADAAEWSARADRIAEAVRTRMWDDTAEMFFDVDAGTGALTGVKSAACFAPYATDLVRAEHLPGLERHLLDPDEFWTPFPVPSMARDDPRFSATGIWKGKREGRPWNGRTWPLTNSQVVEALARSAAHEPRFRERTAQLVHRFVRMMFEDGDLARPSCYEHYNPLTGQGSAYRGIDDHQQSWVADLIIAHVMGVRPHAEGITIDPFPFGLERAELTGVEARGRRVDVFIDAGHVTARVDDAIYECALGEAIDVPA